MPDYRGPPDEKRRPGQGAADLNPNYSASPPEYPTTRPEDQVRSRLRLVELKAVRKNSLCGFAVVELPNGIIIRELAVHSKNGKRWVSMPGRPVLGPDGRHVEKDGKKQWVPLVGWRDRALAAEFGRRVIALVETQHPGALAEAAP
jgi:hypothetical protein